MDKQLVKLPIENILEAMPLIEKWVPKAFNTGAGETSYESLIGKSLIGTVQVWVSLDDGVPKGITTTELIEYESYRALHVITTGGENGYGFEDYHYALEDFAKAMSCKDIQFWGRPAWSKAADRINGPQGENYKAISNVFSMEFDYEQ